MSTEKKLYSDVVRDYIPPRVITQREWAALKSLNHHTREEKYQWNIDTYLTPRDDAMEDDPDVLDYGDERLLKITTDEFLSGRERRYGTRNPELQDVPFWNAVIYSHDCPGGAYEVLRETIGSPETLKFMPYFSKVFQHKPTWTFWQRIGQTMTKLPDGRRVYIAGVHEDCYNPDFCLYNDVLVIEPSKTIKLYGYPELEFQPRLYHSATLVGNDIWIIGGSGNKYECIDKPTVVYRLDTRDFSIHAVETEGESPGEINEQRATLISDTEIQITRGMLIRRREREANEDEEGYSSLHNRQTFVLDIKEKKWRKVHVAY